jgi:subtilisin-like proprotein convertase family protein
MKQNLRIPVSKINFTAFSIRKFKPTQLITSNKTDSTRIPSRYAVILLVLFSLFTQVSTAQTNTWDGSSNANWNTAANWSLNLVPTASHDVVIPDGITATINVNTAAVCKSITMNGGGTANTVSIAAGQSLTVTNGITINAGTGSGDHKILAVGSGTLTAASISLAATANDNRRCEVSVSTGIINITGDIVMNGTAARNVFRFTGAGTLNIGGNMTGGSLVPSTGTVNCYTSSAQTMSGGYTYNNLTINKVAAANTVNFSTAAITTTNLTVTSGKMILSASDANFTVSNDLTVSANGTLTHSVDWATSRLLSVGGNIAIDGIFTYTVRSHVQMTSAGNKTVRTGSNALSAFCIFTLTNGNFSANGTVTVNDNFWSMFGTGGSFRTNGQNVYANASLIISGGTTFVDGGTLNVTGGVQAGSGVAGVLNISSGTLNTDVLTLGSGAITGSVTHSGGTANISGDLSISLTGTYTCSGSPAINIGGDWINNHFTASFVPASSTVTFNSTTAAQNIRGTVASQTFNNVIVNKPAQQLSVSGSTTSLALNGSVTLTAGTFDVGLALAISVAGNWTNNGAAFTPGSGTITFNGGAAQTINGSTVTTFNNLTLNNSTGLSLNGVDAILSGGASALTFSNGKITTGTNKLILGNSATIAGAGTGKYVYGNLQMGVPTGTPTRVFEIGDAAAYAPVSVIFNAVTVSGNVTAFTIGTEHPNILASTIDESKSVNRYWSLANSGVSLTNYTPTFNFLVSDIDAGAATASFIIGRRTSSWAYPTMGTRNPTNTTATLTSFGTYGIGEGGAAIPAMTTQPADQSLCAGGSLSFIAAANNKPASSVTWEISTDNGVSFSTLVIASPYSVSTNTVSNVTTSTLTINPVTGGMDGYSYRAVFTNSRGSITSFDGMITVLAVPTANAGAALAPICGSGSSAPLGGSVGGSATGGTWSTPSGGTFSPNATTLNATWQPPGGFTGTATLTLTTSGGSCTPATASKTQVVGASPTAVTINPSSANVCVNGIQSLTVTSSANATASSGTVNIAIPDNNAAGATSSVAVSGIPLNSTINNVIITFNVSHLNVGDLIINLRAPNGNILNLVNRRGGTGDNFTNTVVSSAGITAFSSSATPFTNTYAADAANAVGPTGQVSNVTLFSSLYGTPNGNWVISARDAASGTSGTINSWSISVNYTEPITWTPITNLYTNAGATVAYVAGTNFKTVYAKPTAVGTTTYTATATNDDGCTSTQTTTVTAGPIVTITPDYCYGGGYIQLTASSTPAATSWLWSTGATTSSILVNLAGNYTATATTAGGCSASATAPIAQELVVNGNFSAGNTGFTSSYSYVSPTVPNGMYPEATYTVNNNPTFNHNYFFGRDHTTNTGNLMIINGSGSPVTVWQQTLTVQPNTTYYFSAWAISLNDAAPFAQLQFDINGSPFGTTAVLPAGPTNNNPPYNWVQFYGTWTSGAGVTSATVGIKDLQTALGGNDFGLDDISFGTLSTFVTLSSSSGTDAQSVCKNTPITNITYSVGAGATGPSVTGLPAGVGYSFNGTTLTISGTPTVAGIFNYTVTNSSCNPITRYGQITVRQDTLTRTSASGTDAQTTCQNSAITNITYSVTGPATGATVTGLPAGVTGNYNAGVFTISGTPTVAGVFNYTVSTTGGCAAVSMNGTINVHRQIITRTSAAGTNAQTLCVNTAITNITYSIGGTATGAGVTGLPAGVTGSYASGVFTISGTPTVVGVFNYTVTTTGTCNSVSASGTITATGPTVVLTSAVGTNAQSVCVNASITSITYTIGGTATGAGVSGLPAGVTGIYNTGVFTISGTPTTAGVYNYTITTSGGSCGTTTANGTITVNIQTVSLTSAVGTNAQSVCVNNAITSITYAVGGSGTGAGVTGLPTGVSGAFSGGTFTISGTPTVTGTFNYTVTTTGTCTAATATGSITVNAATITLTSTAGTTSQTVCRNTAISNITYSIGGTATGAGVSGLPAGVTGSFSAGTFTISGTPTASGTFNYTVTTTGGTCSAVTANGTITVNVAAITLTSAVGTTTQTVCRNTAISNITYSIGGTATGAGVSGLPAGVTGSFSAGTFTISGTPTVAGTFNYTVTSTGGSCAAATASGSITVSNTPVGGTIADQSVCFGDNGTVTVTGIVGTVTGWEVSTNLGATWSPVSNTTTSLNFTNATQATMYRVLVQNGACTTPVLSNSATVGIHNLWVGSTSSDWNTPSNWSDGLLPSTSCVDVTIPVLTAPNVYPQLTSGTATVNNLVIYPNATMQISNATLQVAGTITNNGVLNAVNGTVELNGTSAAQSIAGSLFQNNSIHNLVVSNSNGVSFTGTNDTMKITGLLSFGTSNAILNTNNNLTLVSNAAGTASVGDLTAGGLYTGNNITGNVTVERYIPLHPKAWQLLAVPTSGQSINAAWQEGNATLQDLRPGYGTTIASNISGALGLGFDFYTPTGGSSMKTYNPLTNNWDGVANTSMPIANKRGYMFFVRGDRSVTTSAAPAVPTTLRTTGKLFTIGADAPQTTTVLAGKMESIGNPYASAIDFTKITKPAAPNVDDKFYVWDPLLTNGYYGLGGYQTISATNGWKPTPGGTANYDANTAYPFIQSGQAFFVNATGAGGTVAFSEACKTTNTTMVNRAMVRMEDREFLRAGLYNASGFLSDGNVVAFDPVFNNAVDADDALKLTNTSENFGIMRAGKNLSIEAHGRVTGMDTVFYSIGNLKRQEYRLKFGPENMDTTGLTATLIDKFANTATAVSLVDTTQVGFTVTTDLASSASDRFYIVFNRVVPPAITQIGGTHTTRTAIKVTWTTANESNMATYEIQRSANGRSFVTVGSNASTVNNQAAINYQFEDLTAPFGTNFYRVKGVKYNGDLIYSSIIKVLPQKVVTPEPASLAGTTAEAVSQRPLSVYPNPVINKTMHIDFGSEQPGTYKIELISTAGQVVFKSAHTIAKSAVDEVRLPASLSAGNYQLRITGPEGKINIRQLNIQ